MSTKKIIAIIGSTGHQGGSVARTFLNDPSLNTSWTVRAISRDITKDAARELESQGAQLVKADIDDEKSLASAFSVSLKLEVQQGKKIVDTAKDAGVQHFIYSSLIDVKQASNGELSNVYHFDSKAAVEEYARNAGIPATFFLPGFFMSNIPGQFFTPSASGDSWILSFPTSEEAQYPLFDAVADTGKYVKAIVLKRDQVLGKRVLGATAYVTPAQMLADFKATFPTAGKNAQFFSISQDMFKASLMEKGTPEFVAIEMLENFLLMDNCGYYAEESLGWSLSLLGDQPTTWIEHMKASEAFKKLQ